MMGFVRKALLVTHPLAIPVGVGVFCAVVLKNLFGGVAKDCVKIVKSI